MIELQQDRSHQRQGAARVYINPDQVSAVICNESDFDKYNQTVVILTTGDRISVVGSTYKVAQQIIAARKASQ